MFCGFLTCQFFVSLGLCIEENNQGTLNENSSVIKSNSVPLVCYGVHSSDIQHHS